MDSDTVVRDASRRVGAARRSCRPAVSDRAR
ncbi:hypothetical protein ALC60_13646 [Trachymyrmex zeteki]|uniref:Uncharacterized protein n=1 Tax=Mycetomoellerius zeteki TaxID=64791 RepID=A0A151WHJ4_9HYME|nr:hypothetical protein ALC60_13646 [Trachymyrmex zeteki]